MLIVEVIQYGRKRKATRKHIKIHIQVSGGIEDVQGRIRETLRRHGNIRHKMDRMRVRARHRPSPENLRNPKRLDPGASRRRLGEGPLPLRGEGHQGIFLQYVLQAIRRSLFER